MGIGQSPQSVQFSVDLVQKFSWVEPVVLLVESLCLAWVQNFLLHVGIVVFPVGSGAGESVVCAFQLSRKSGWESRKNASTIVCRTAL